MPAGSLNQRSGALQRWVLLGGVFLDGFSFGVRLSSAVQSFGPRQRLLSDASCGARFKLLSAGAGSKHGDLCNEQIRDSNERFNLCLRVFEAQAQDKRAPLLPKHSSAN